MSEAVFSVIVVAPAVEAVRARYEPSEVVRIDALTPAFALLIASRNPLRLLVELVNVIGTVDPPAVRYNVFVSVGATAVVAALATALVIVAVETDASDVMFPMVYVPAAAPLPLMEALTFVSLEDAVSAPEDASEAKALMAVVRVPTADCKVASAVASLFRVASSFCKAVTGT